MKRVVVSCLLVVLLAGACGESREVQGQKIKSKDNIKNMLTMMMMRVTQQGVKGWPQYSGRNFVLSLVARGQLDRRNAYNLEILFSPGPGGREPASPEAYGAVTKAALKAGTDFSHLTDYVGRRNGGGEHAVTAQDMRLGTPLIADLSFPDCAIVGFSNGAVKELDREELGLEPDDPIVAGDKSKSPILRMLSDR